MDNAVEIIKKEKSMHRWDCALGKTVGSVVVEINSENIHRHIKMIGQEQGNLINFSDVVIYALAHSLKEFPEFNSNFDTELRLKSNINVGFFINIDKGSRMAVIKDADKKSLIEISLNIVMS